MLAMVQSSFLDMCYDVMCTCLLVDQFVYLSLWVCIYLVCNSVRVCVCACVCVCVCVTVCVSGCMHMHICVQQWCSIIYSVHVKLPAILQVLPLLVSVS